VLPAVWFQMFEYAISHWLQKTAEHVFGCVLCSPGCFSLFRAEALMDDNVMKKYSTTSTEPSHYIQYDQGWRVEYNAASDAYTNAPEDFKELYNQLFAMISAILAPATICLMVAVSLVKEKTILTPSSICVLAISIIYIVTALMHPQELPLVFYGFLYIACIPSAYLLRTIYSMVNMNSVS
ncbi:hypothetical protein GOODEAATRI_032034, partial [Goodea atripinnis]